MLRKRLFRKGIDIFFEIRNIVNQQKIVNLLIFANRRFSWKMDFLVCLLMIVSIDTIMWDRQIVLFFGQDTVVVDTCEIQLFIFFKKRGCYC